MDCIEAYLLGLFVGDGWFDKRGIAFSTKSYVLMERIVVLVKTVYRVKPKVCLRRYRDGHELYVVRVWNIELMRKYQTLLKTGRKKSLTAVPLDIMSRDFMICFVKGLYDAESWTYMWRGRMRVSIEIYNESISRYILNTFNSLGIKAYLSKCNDGAYRIDVTGKHVYTLLKYFNYVESHLPPTPQTRSRKVPAVNDAG